MKIELTTESGNDMKHTMILEWIWKTGTNKDRVSSISMEQEKQVKDGDGGGDDLAWKSWIFRKESTIFSTQYCPAK